MKTSILVAAVMALIVPVWAQDSDFSAAKSSWSDVRQGARELDAIIAQRKMAEVHNAAFNLRDSVRELRDAPIESDAQRDKLVGLIGHFDALARAMDTSGDKNDVRATALNQRKIHLILDQIVALFPVGTLQKVGPVTAKTPVIDPVCGMTVTPSSAPGRAVYGGQTYYFCSKPDAVTFQKAPARYAARYEEIAYGKPKTYAMSVATAGKVVAGKPATLAFAVREQGQTLPVKKFQLVHEKLMHLIAVSDDLSFFSHEHPHLGADGRFRLQTQFPRGGQYLLFGDFTPADGLNQILRGEVEVAGSRGAKANLVADKALSQVVEGITVSLQLSRPLKSGKSSLLTYTLQKDGKPLNDMEPYLGAMGHLMAIHRNGRDVVHTHTVAAGGGVTNAMATASGPRFTYELTPRAAGLTKIWAQFQRGGRVLTVPFTFDIG